MEHDMISQIMQTLEVTRKSGTIVHCITNYVAATDSANALLAVGATPVMADCPYECGDITRRSRTLLLNMGTFSEGHYEAFKSSAEAALEIGIPFVLDPVGLSASGYRQKCFQEIVASHCPSVIKCNLSEAYTVACLAKVKAESPLEMCQKIACKLNCAVMITGSDDYISDGFNSCILHGGTAKLTKVTGTGCVTGALTAAFLSVTDRLTACITAAALMKTCGVIAEEKSGNGLQTFRTKLYDGLSEVGENEIRRCIEIESVK